MTTALEPMDKDFEQMMQMLSGFWVTQIAGAVPSYSITDHLAKRSATAQQISAIAGTDKAKIRGVIDNDMFSIFIGWPIEKFHQVRSNIAGSIMQVRELASELLAPELTERAESLFHNIRGTGNTTCKAMTCLIITFWNAK
jgi:hypothetical protein